jgi:hypothetical protein
MGVFDAEDSESSKSIHILGQRHPDAVTSQYIGEFDDALFHR